MLATQLGIVEIVPPSAGDLAHVGKYEVLVPLDRYIKRCVAASKAGYTVRLEHELFASKHSPSGIITHWIMMSSTTVDLSHYTPPVVSYPHIALKKTELLPHIRFVGLSASRNPSLDYVVPSPIRTRGSSLHLRNTQAKDICIVSLVRCASHSVCHATALGHFGSKKSCRKL